jgi:hypothetical protein
MVWQHPGALEMGLFFEYDGVCLFWKAPFGGFESRGGGKNHIFVQDIKTTNYEEDV